MEHIDNRIYVRYNTNIEQLFGINVRIFYDITNGGLKMTASERRIYNNRIRRQQQLRRNIFMIVFTIVLILTLSVSGFAIGSKAQDKEEVVLYKYYTNIEVQYGETLWDIAATYFCKDRYDNYEHYISEVMQINGLYIEDVSPGSYLIVPYYSAEFK